MPDSGKVTLPSLAEKKRRGEKITMLTAYDAPIARLLDQAEIDLVLVGDSLGMVALGYTSTASVTMDEMIHHAKAVRRAVSRALLVGDMPFKSFGVSREETLRNAGRFLKEAGCDAVKIEGGQWAESLESIRTLVQAGIPVMGHLGLTPQTADALGGFKVQGRDAESARRILDASIQVEAAGCFALVLECVPEQLGREISKRLSIPVIGIGAGAGCDGQVLVTHDLLNLTGGFNPKFARAFARVDQEALKAMAAFKKEVLAGTFPARSEVYSMPEDQWRVFCDAIGAKT